LREFYLQDKKKLINSPYADLLKSLACSQGRKVDTYQTWFTCVCSR